MNKSQIGGFLYRLGISYYDFGAIKNGRKKVADYFKTDRLTEDQRAAIVAAIPPAYFLGAAPQYAPEIRRVLICIPAGRAKK